MLSGPLDDVSPFAFSVVMLIIYTGIWTVLDYCGANTSLTFTALGFSWGLASCGTIGSITGLPIAAALQIIGLFWLWHVPLVSIACRGCDLPNRFASPFPQIGEDYWLFRSPNLMPWEEAWWTLPLWRWAGVIVFIATVLVALVRRYRY